MGQDQNPSATPNETRLETITRRPRRTTRRQEMEAARLRGIESRNI